jgi:alkanesulfonate monooxygenase SsuD/methylene tetrahydromethanopterin reductase-like flavin-dependent oxidoreductase (luciferase family)
MTCVDIYFTIRGAPLSELRAQVHWIEAHGGAGVMAADHLFVGGGVPRQQARRGFDPLVVLSAVATLSERLQVGTSVSNIGLLHPALVLRQFAQLAELIGGQRVFAGLGAGWNREEFDALGMRMPPFSERMERLEEAAKLARELFDRGSASLEAKHVVARELPLSPLPQVPPRLFLGGGSDRLLDIAGHYADMLDLNGTSSAGALRGQNLPRADLQRRMSTTVNGLERSVKRVQAAASAAGRQANAVAFSLLINHVIFCNEQQRDEEANRIRTSVGLEPGSLDECPYVLIGEPERMLDRLRERQSRLGIRALLLVSSIAPETSARLMSEVIARL